ncbi:TonB-dependent receptor domain-containing protein [Sphingomonas mucosissima]|uniref:Ferrichrome outer membrane transporter n=1 Tax=Sphingomonas mucosissima TaxID=370959 RepID=A0A245ZJJ4_9SPHN|nr:TonB-dependent receptor [Sphingomonas mucosissima]OWK29907.1 ferrichrome outer membrane transporter [Sphingomonas mucosissima]
MKNYLLVAAAPIALLAPVAASAAPKSPAGPVIAAQAPQGADIVTTGVAKGRDRLDSATSTSSLRESEIRKLAPSSVGDLLRDIPGIRSEASTGEGSVSLSIRGLPIASSGAKFVQLQEDGLPVLEFGDIQGAGADNFLRVDLNLSQVSVIRGGSASTFASNSPGGIINFVSKTGEVEGGAVAVTAGLDFNQYRTDFDYGARLTDSVRFHVGGFYRQGEGPRRTGYDAQKGGQIKANVTKELTGGYIRLYGKYLDDRTPFYEAVPFRATGTNADPKVTTLPGFDGVKDTLLSRNIRSNLVLDGNNNVTVNDVAEGQSVKAASLGLEAQIDLNGWTVTERFRFSDLSGTLVSPFTSAYLPAAVGAQSLGGAGATLSYANGPRAGQVIADPSTLNGNGLLVALNMLDLRLNSYDNVTNDLRASRVWQLGGGDLTTTAGFYAARQTIDRDALWTTFVSELRGDGEAALLNITDRAGRAVTQDGAYAYNLALARGTRRRSLRVDYAVNAPFASVNYHIGRVAIGGSIRYDYGNAEGRIFGSDLGGGRVGTVARDMNGDSVISIAEQKVGVTPLSAPAPVDYKYDYLSYSAGINFRIADPLAVFARYSRGARANADRILFSNIVSTTDGSLLIPSAAFDPVKQAEAGVKYRRADLTLNLTGFWAKAQDTNVDPVTSGLIARDYEAFGLEFEGGYRRGVFSLTAGGTYTDAEIVRDRINPAVAGNIPRHQAKFIFQTTPQIVTERFAVGAVLIGTTGSFAQDDNVLRMPGFVTTNAFLQFRPVPRLELTLNASNLFNVKAFNAFDDASIPATGIVRGRPLNGRNTSLTARLDF